MLFVKRLSGNWQRVTAGELAEMMRRDDAGFVVDCLHAVALGTGPGGGVLSCTDPAALPELAACGLVAEDIPGAGVTGYKVAA